MNIGVDLRCLLTPYRTGVGEYTVELLQAILQVDQTNQYYFFYNSFSEELPAAKEFNFPNVHILRTKIPNKLFSLLERIFHYPKLDTLLKKRFKLAKLDYFFSPHLNFTSLSGDTKHIITIHDLTFELFPNFLTFKQRLWHRFLTPKNQCHNANLILTPSENTKRDIANLYHVEGQKISVLYPGLSNIYKRETPVVTNKYNLPSKFILFLGTIEPRKNLDSLVEAFEIFSKKFPDYKLVIAGGSGWKNNLSLYQKNPKIIYIGYVEETDKPNLYRSASVFVYPSFYEGFGFPVLEAMSVGLPVVTSNRSSLPEIASDAALFVNPNRPEEIAFALEQILTSPKYASELSEKGKQKAKNFNWDNAAKNFLNVLNSID